jgi:hypothetical protein
MTRTQQRIVLALAVTLAGLSIAWGVASLSQVGRLFLPIEGRSIYDDTLVLGAMEPLFVRVLAVPALLIGAAVYVRSSPP